MNASARKDEVPERDESLWVLVASPGIWVAHFLLTYGTAAIWCAKFAGPDRSLGPARVAVVAYTLVALGALAVVGRRGYLWQAAGGSPSSHELAAPEDRHRFIGFTVVTLSGLSAVAVVFEALPALMIGSCR